MKSCKILIVDDIPENVESIAGMIEKYHFDVKKALSGDEAIQLVDSFEPNIILLDLMMPGTNGWDVIEYVRSKYEKEKMIIIVTSLLSNHDNIDECYEMGVNDYICKPILEHRLVNSLETYSQLVADDDEIETYRAEAQHHQGGPSDDALDAPAKVLSLN